MEKLVCLLVLMISLINGHNYLMNPASRANQGATQTGCRFGGEGNPTCAGPCDRPKGQSQVPAITVQRGANIQITWNRHTHPGGFIRFAWSPTADSDSHASFDVHVDKFVCKEVGGCGPSNPASPAGDSNGLACGTTITVPLYLTNGAWTLQWAYFGGWFNAGDYYACVDYIISGGPTGDQQVATYSGGDFTYPHENVCLFYSTNALHVCTAEPCLNGTFPAGNQKGAPLGFSSNTGNTPNPPNPPNPPPTPVTTKAITTKAMTTSKLTTGKVASSTTGKASTTTTTTTTTTTGNSVPSTTTGSPPSTSSCTLWGAMKCATSETYQTCLPTREGSFIWGAPQSCQVGLTCHPSGNYIYCY